MSGPENLTIISPLREDDDRYDLRSQALMTKLAAAGDGHFWNRTRNLFIEHRLRSLGVRPGARVLDLGCGGGCVSRHLSNAGYDVVGVEGHAALGRRAAQRAPRAKFYVLDIGTMRDRLAPKDFDVVGMFDVIEHLDDPLRALADALAACRPGGLVVGTVPALQSLWSSLDEISGHRLRYERGNLLELCERVPSGHVLEVNYFFRSLVPLLWLQRRAMKKEAEAPYSELDVPPAPINMALSAMVRLEHSLGKLLDKTPLPGGCLWFAIQRN
ncbi:MAG: class I SAM-dependent methyltransferase [Polyangiaceae bacterium]